jgi:hypothetical protein
VPEFLCCRMIWVPHPFPLRNGSPPLCLSILPVCIARLHLLAGEGAGGPKSRQHRKSGTLYTVFYDTGRWNAKTTFRLSFALTIGAALSTKACLLFICFLPKYCSILFIKIYPTIIDCLPIEKGLCRLPELLQKDFSLENSNIFLRNECRRCLLKVRHQQAI